jgi:hypothetical protein
MRSLLLLAMLFITGISFSQQALLKIPASGKKISDFIPAGYDTLGIATGDLNKDLLGDHAMVLNWKSEDSLSKAGVEEDSIPPRILVVLLKNGSGYTLAATSTTAIMCHECGGVFGEPFASIAIENGILVIYHYGGSAWRWEYTHKFRYQQNDFFLIGTTTRSYWNVKMCDKLKDFAGTETKDVNWITGGYAEKKISENCKLLVNKKGKNKAGPLKSLSTFNIDL